MIVDVASFVTDNIIMAMIPKEHTILLMVKIIDYS